MALAASAALVGWSVGISRQLDQSDETFIGSRMVTDTEVLDFLRVQFAQLNGRPCGITVPTTRVPGPSG